LTVLAAGLVVSLACAAPGVAGSDDDVAQLQALLEAQQQRIDSLQQQVADASTQDSDAARLDAMRNQIREILGEQEFRESLMPSMLQAGYDNGFFIRSSDDQFLMKFHGRMQFRWNHYATRSDNRYLLPRTERDDQTGFDIKRVRFHIDGHVYTPDLTYFLKFFADAPAGYDVQVLYAWLNYRFRDEFQMKFGMFQLASTRAGFASSGNMQFVEYPETVAVFDPGEGLGVRIWGQLFEKKLEYFLDIANSLNGRANRTITTDGARELDNNPAIVFRAVWHAIGEEPTRDFVSWADIDHKETPCLDLGFHYMFNDDAGDLRTTRVVFGRRTPLEGGFGVTNSNGVQINQFGLDAAFKYRGFSLSGEYMLRMLDVRRAWRTPYAPLWLLTGDDSTTVMHGAYVQTGYFLPIPGLEKKLEAVARVGGISTNHGQQEGTWFYSAGLNYYLQGNKVKLQTDVTKISEVPISSTGWLGNVNDDALIWRVQLQVAF
jgi:hypothetical protein